jgi:hypothetical protein
MFTFGFSMYGTFYSYVEFGLWNIHYFTNQSNLLVFLTTFLMVFGWDKNRFFKAIALMALLDIILTGVVYNVLLKDLVLGFTETQLFIMLVTHTIVPMLYTVLYLVYVLDKPSPKAIKLMLIHPLLYFVIFQIIGLFTNDYPYPFMDPNQGILKMIITVFLVMAPLLILTGFGLIHLKRYLYDTLKLEA